MSEGILRIAMWSGPRNISTAMMRAWENRGDTFVIDEPLYAHYLFTTKREHPGAAETISAGPTDINDAIDTVLATTPDEERIFYQKHMTHHLLPEIGRGWIRKLLNCFLIREPKEMLTSLIKHVPDTTLHDTGCTQQVEIFELVRKWTGKAPPVLDARDVLDNPRKMLGLLCESVGVDFTDRMLSWPAGLRKTDGPWAKYWYKEVETTTSFRPYKAKGEAVLEEFRGVLKECERCYEALYRHRLR